MVWKWVSPTRLLPSSLQFAQATPSSLCSSDGECQRSQWSQVLPHCGVHSALCKVNMWPALLDFKTYEEFRLWPHSRLVGKPWLEFKKDTCAHTHHANRHSGTHFVFLEGPLRASLSFPPTHSSLLTLTIAVTTCILFSWIFQALQSSRCCYIYSAWTLLSRLNNK